MEALVGNRLQHMKTTCVKTYNMFFFAKTTVNRFNKVIDITINHNEYKYIPLANVVRDLVSR